MVDGVLEPEVRLPPEEARRAAGRGLHLFGAASLGALLAADPCVRDCVRGVGRVFRLLCQGRAVEDDVALLYAAHDLRPLTLPAVDVLCWLDEQVSSGRIPPGDAETALAAFRALPITDRVPTAAAQRLRCHPVGSTPTAGALRFNSAKASDARVLLRVLRAMVSGAGNHRCLGGRLLPDDPASAGADDDEAK